MKRCNHGFKSTVEHAGRAPIYVARVVAEFRQLYGAELSDVLCEREAGHIGRHHWGSVSWVSLGQDPRVPDPEGDKLMEAKLRARAIKAGLLPRNGKG